MAAHIRAAGYGRIVNTTSGAMWGMAGLSIYAAAKFGIYGLTHGLALEGSRHGIKVNAVSTRRSHQLLRSLLHAQGPGCLRAVAEAQPAELVSPMVAYLGHESCELTGGLFDSSAGTIQPHVFGTTPGFSSRDLTIEDVRDHLDELLDVDNLVIATDPHDSG